MDFVSGVIEVIHKLLQGGADTSAQDAVGEPPFQEAFCHQHDSIVVSMLSTSPILLR